MTHPIVIQQARIFDGHTLLPAGDVLVQDGQILAVGDIGTLPAEAQVIDGSGCTLLPGLIDAHVHMRKHMLRQALIFGVTTELDMCCPGVSVVNEIKQRQAAGLDSDLADIRSAGAAATAPGGHASYPGMPIPTLTSPQEAQAFVDARIAEGSDYIKIIYDDCTYVTGHPRPTLSKETVAAVVEAAHQRGKLAIAHVVQYPDALDALEVGIDGLAHLFTDQLPGPDFGGRAAASHAFVVPTLTTLESATGVASGASLCNDPAIAPYLTSFDTTMATLHFPTAGSLTYAAAEEGVRQLRASSVPILAGTDAPVPGVLHGASLHRELELLVQAGLSPLEALTAATATPAQIFSLTDRGRIAPGLRADLVLVYGDPTTDITATRAIVGIWKQGVPVEREIYRQYVAQHTEPPTGSASGLISDFADGTLRTSFGAGWEIDTDAVVAGHSTASYRVVPEGPHSNAGALLISGKIAAEQSITHAGAVFYPGGLPLLPANLSNWQGISFWARGDQRTYHLRLMTTQHIFTPPEVSFVAPETWQQFHFPFSQFGKVNGEGIMSMLFTADATPGPFSFQLSDIRLQQ